METTFEDSSNIGPRFERFKFTADEQNKTKRIIFINRKLWKDAVHYQDDYGYFRCLTTSGVACPACAAGKSAQDRWGTHVLEYLTDLDGNVSTPFSYTVKAFVFGNGKGNGTFSVLHNIRKQLGEKMFSQDFTVTCDNPKYQTLRFLPTQSCSLIEVCNGDGAMLQKFKDDYNKKIADIDVTRVVAPYVEPNIAQQVVDGKIVRRNTKNVTAPPANTAPAASVATPTAAIPSFPNAALSAPKVAVTTTVEEPGLSVSEKAKKMMDSLSI